MLLYHDRWLHAFLLSLIIVIEDMHLCICVLIVLIPRRSCPVGRALRQLCRGTNCDLQSALTEICTER